ERGFHIHRGKGGKSECIGIMYFCCPRRQPEGSVSLGIHSPRGSCTTGWTPGCPARSCAEVAAPSSRACNPSGTSRQWGPNESSVLHTAGVCHPGSAMGISGHL